MTTTPQSDYFALVGRVYFQCRAADSLAIDIARGLDKAQVPYDAVRRPSGVIADILARSARVESVSNSQRKVVLTAAVRLEELVQRRTVVLQSRPGRDDFGHDLLYRRPSPDRTTEPISREFLRELADDLDVVVRALAFARDECLTAMAA